MIRVGVGEASSARSPRCSRVILEGEHASESVGLGKMLAVSTAWVRRLRAVRLPPL